MPENMTFYEYERLAIQTAAAASIESSGSALLNAALGFAGESGEFCDILKKCLYHGHKMDKESRAKLQAEVGDILWYASLAAYGLGTTMETIAQGNIEKLRKRYPDGFSSERSKERYSGGIVKNLEEGERITG